MISPFNFLANCIASPDFPDTVGYTVPSEFKKIIETLINKVPNIDKAVLSTHCHNDLGLAVANSLAGVAAGARQIECTINGIGAVSYTHLTLPTILRV